MISDEVFHAGIICRKIVKRQLVQSVISCVFIVFIKLNTKTDAFIGFVFPASCKTERSVALCLYSYIFENLAVDLDITVCILSVVRSCVRNFLPFIISDDEIWFSKQEKPDVLLTLTQPSMNKFSKDTTPQSTIIADTGLSIPGNCAASKIYRIPILETASKVVGKPMTANIVAVSAINTILGLFPEDIMLEAVKMHIPAGTEELNMKAFNEGKRITENAKVVFTSAFMTPERM